MPLVKKIVAEPILYDGSQIRGQWALTQFGLEGDSAVCFVGGCDVKPEEMADLEDLRAGSRICADKMLHIVVEHFACNLRLITTRQRFLAAIAGETLAARGAKGLERRGDDLYDGTAKLSVSVATTSRVSGKIHFGINVVRDGTPVEVKALEDYRIEPLEFGRAVIDRYEEEIDGIERAMWLVRGVD